MKNEDLWWSLMTMTMDESLITFPKMGGGIISHMSDEWELSDILGHPTHEYIVEDKGK